MTRVRINDEPERLDLRQLLAEIPPERRVRAMGFRFERDRRLSVAAYLLLKEMLREGYGLRGDPRLTLGPNGKPYLADHPDIHFNFSHCAKAAACVVSDRPVGVDIEAIAPVDYAVARRVLSEAELAEMDAAAAPEVAFVRFWTRKEAVVKLSGEGIREDRLPSLLADAREVVLKTTVCREKGYVYSVATASAGGCARCGGDEE